MRCLPFNFKKIINKKINSYHCTRFKKNTTLNSSYVLILELKKNKILIYNRTRMHDFSI